MDFVQPEITSDRNNQKSTFAILTEINPAARVCVARELTKKFETYHRGTAEELHAHFTAHPPKGEIVLLVHG